MQRFSSTSMPDDVISKIFFSCSGDPTPMPSTSLPTVVPSGVPTTSKPSTTPSIAPSYAPAIKTCEHFVLLTDNTCQDPLNRDMMFLMDTSSSISQEEFDTYTDVFANVIEARWTLGARAALIQYTTQPKTELEFGLYSGSEIADAARNMEQLGGGTWLSEVRFIFFFFKIILATMTFDQNKKIIFQTFK